jgi:hypothetical protein
VNRGVNNPHARFRSSPLVKWLDLACGHTIKVATEPFNPGAVYACTYKAGCGYTVAWLRYYEDNHAYMHTNPLYIDEDGNRKDVPQ